MLGVPMTALSDSDAVIAKPLLGSGVVSNSAIEKAQAYQRHNGGLLSDALLRLNLVRESDFLRVFAELYSVQFVKASQLKDLKINDELLERVGCEPWSLSRPTTNATIFRPSSSG